MSARPATLRVAALQLNSATGEVAGNLSRAVPFVEDAAASGAQLVLLPELYSSGFVFERRLWDAAERLEDGATRTWLCALAARLRLHLGTSVLEARGAHFYNTFMLAQPDGALAGVVRKKTPAALEAFFFAPGEPRGADAHVIACPLLGGLRVAVGICYENAMEYMARYAAQARADLLLMPHSACRVEGVPASVVAAYDDVLAAMPRRYALALGIPVVLANKSGPWTSTFLGAFALIAAVWGSHSRRAGAGLRAMVFEAGFPGQSQIVDADGTVLAPPTCEENAVLCATVHVPPAGTAAAAPLPRRSAWRKFSALAPHPLLLRVIFTVDEAIGAAVYRSSAERRRRALAASGGVDDDGGWLLPPRVIAVAGVAAPGHAARMHRPGRAYK